MKRVLVFCAIALAFTVTQASADVKPYGFVLFNTQYNTSWNTDIPVFASEYEEETPSLLMTARQSRVGVKIKLDAMFDPMGKVEMDFWGLGGSAANGGVLQSAPRLRLAFMTFSFMDGCLKLTAGQDWVKAFAPYSPSTIAHVSIPGFSSSGNLWNRLPQIRVDYTMDMDMTTMMFQGAIVRPFGADVDPHNPYGLPGADQEATQGDYIGAGELSQTPFGQARVAVTYDDMVTVGVSGHAGQMDFSKKKPWHDGSNTHTYNGEELDEKINTYGVAGDLKIVTPMVEIMGEGFWGQNLPMYFSNLRLGFEDTGGTDGIVGIAHPQGVGGWGQLSVKTSEITKVNLGGGVEILSKDDLTEAGDIWGSIVGQNMTIFANAMCMAVEGCVFSIEYGYIQTKRVMNANAGVAGADYEADFDEGAENHSVNVGFQMNF